MNFTALSYIEKHIVFKKNTSNLIIFLQTLRVTMHLNPKVLPEFDFFCIFIT